MFNYYWCGWPTWLYDTNQGLSINDFLHNFRFDNCERGIFENVNKIASKMIKHDWGKWVVIFFATFICGSQKKNFFNTENSQT